MLLTNSLLAGSIEEGFWPLERSVLIRVHPWYAFVHPRSSATAKDFRTWAGTLLAVAALTEVGEWSTQRQAKSNVIRAIDRVAEQLNNTRAVCRKYYVHPAVFDAYLAGTMLEALQNGTKHSVKRDLNSEEASVVRLLQHYVSESVNVPRSVPPV